MCGFLIRVGKETFFPTGLLNHRGPDETHTRQEALWRVEYNRLAITGVFDGTSPAMSQNRRFTIYLNGEIYNFRDLQVRFNLPLSNSDSVTLGNLFESQGIDSIAHIRGMYAILIHDNIENLAYVARDPLGEKPIFFSRADGGLTLASEFRAVLKCIGGSLELNQKAVHDYLRYNYVEEPNTFDIRIEAFPKGRLAQIDLKTGALKFTHKITGYSENELDTPLEELLIIVLNQALYTEVNSALSLSSGVDSTALLIHKMHNLDAKFSTISLQTSFDMGASEASEAVMNAKLVGANIDVVSTDQKLFPDLIWQLVDAMDQPICDPSALNYFLIFERAHALSKKVIFLGQGPDEFFWGYPYYFQYLEKINSHELKLEDSLLTNVPQQSRRLLANLSPLEISSHRRLNSSDNFLLSSNPWELLRANIVHSYLSNNGFAQIDRLSMNFGIEARSPLADSRIYGWAQHNSVKNSNAYNKMEFRNALDFGNLEHLKFKPKSGFNSDVSALIGNRNISELHSFAYDKVFKENFIDWRFRYPKILFTKNEKWKILILGLWLNSIQSLE